MNQNYTWHCKEEVTFLSNNIVGIPNIHWCGSQGNYNIMVIDLLGPSLEDLFTYCKRKFNLKSVVMLADQMVYIIITRRYQGLSLFTRGISSIEILSLTIS